MIKLISPKYPELRIHLGDANVKFVNGTAEVSDTLAKELLALDDLELAVAGPEDEESSDDAEPHPKSEPEPKPARRTKAK